MSALHAVGHAYDLWRTCEDWKEMIHLCRFCQTHMGFRSGMCYEVGIICHVLAV